MLALGATAGALAADSPFAAFKKIVSLPETEREAAVDKLKISSERHRKLLQAKVREYAAMPEAERDRKLDALDFRWHLMPIMKTAKTDRAKQLASVPERLRTDIERRLIGWDKLEAGVRADLLKNESFFRYRCRSLTSVTIGNSVTSIGGAAFRDCTSLMSVTIGKRPDPQCW